MGYVLAEDGITLVEDAAEQAVIAMISRWRQRGWSLRKIAQRLQDNGVPAKNNARWYPATVLRILQRQRKLAA